MLGLDFFLCVNLGFVFCVFFRVSLGHFVLVLLAFVVLGLVSSVPSQEIGWEHLLNGLFLRQVGRGTLTKSINQLSV